MEQVLDGCLHNFCGHCQTDELGIFSQTTKNIFHSNLYIISAFKNKTKQNPQEFLSMSYLLLFTLNQFSSVQSLSRVRLFVTTWAAAHQVSLSNINSRSPPRLMSIELVMPSNHFILSHPLLLLPPIFPSIRVFSNESVLRIRWLKYWSFSFSISPSNEHPGLISFRMD